MQLLEEIHDVVPADILIGVEQPEMQFGLLLAGTERHTTDNRDALVFARDSQDRCLLHKSLTTTNVGGRLEPRPIHQEKSSPVGVLGRDQAEESICLRGKSRYPTGQADRPVFPAFGWSIGS